MFNTDYDHYGLRKQRHIERDQAVHIWNNLAQVTILYLQLSSSVGAEPDRRTVAPVQPLLD